MIYTECKNEIQTRIDKALLKRNYVIKSCSVGNELLYEVGLKSYIEKKPLHLIGFWGAMHKDKPNYDDFVTIQNLKTYSEHIKKYWPEGCEWTIILCNIHAIKNGYNPERIKQYLQKIAEKINDLAGFQTIYLDSLWSKYNIEVKIANYLQEVKDNWDQNPLASIIEEQAKKHNKSKRCYKESAQFYYAMRCVEAELIERVYSDAIFFNFSTDRLDEIYPKLPKLYLWSLKRGTCTPPWLMKT